MMDKAPDAYRTISEVAEDLDLPQHVLRFWETRFSQIKPLKRGGGRRYYRPDDVELLKGIRHLLYREGYTIKGVQRILKEQGVRAVQAFARSAATPPEMPPPAKAAPAPVLAPAAPLAPPAFEAAPAPAFEDPDASLDDPPEPEDFTPGAFVSEKSVSGQPASGEPVPEEAPRAAPAPSAPRGQVSMFRGGLHRAEGATPDAPLAEFAEQIRARIENPLPRDPGARPLGGRETLQLALDELVACRARIDQILARRGA